MRKLRNKKGGLQSLIRVHRIGFRLLKKIHSVDSVIIPRHLLKICLSLGQVYAGLFLTAELIDALLSGSFRGALEFAAALYFFRHVSADRKFFPIRMIAVFILAGALGNMADRLRLSYVVDFFYFRLIDFPIFNVADIYVSVGTAVLAVLILFYYKEEELNRLLDGRKKGAV